jgi:hypothetical protein
MCEGKSRVRIGVRNKTCNEVLRNRFNLQRGGLFEGHWLQGFLSL